MANSNSSTGSTPATAVAGSPPLSEEVLRELGARLGADAVMTGLAVPDRPFEVERRCGRRRALRFLDARIEHGLADRILDSGEPVRENLTPSDHSFAVGAAVRQARGGSRVFCASFGSEHEQDEGLERRVSLYVQLLDLAGRFPEDAPELLGASSRDPLTGCLNLFGLMGVLEREVQACERYGRPLSVCFIDLDRFKRINDADGHARGNEVLSAVGQSLRERIRETDAVGRYGGDEFVAILPETDPEGALRCAAELGQAVEETGSELLGSALECSIGVAGWEPGLSAEKLLERADGALGRAKVENVAIVGAEEEGAVEPPEAAALARGGAEPSAEEDPGAVGQPDADASSESAVSADGWGLTRRERRADMTMSAGFVFAVAAIAALVPMDRPVTWPTVLALTMIMTACARVRFEVGSLHATPIQLAFVPMLLILPPLLVPFLVATSFSLNRAVDIARGYAAPGPSLSPLADSWFSVGPVLVLALFAAGVPGWDHWPIYLAALAAQVVGEAITSAVRDRLRGTATGPRRIAARSRIYLIDALLTPIGVLVAIASVSVFWPALVVLPLAGMVAMFAREKREHIASARALREAYRGTARVLGEVVEHDDAYTGEHTRGVTELALGVASELGLDDERQRNVEFGAILHDVGKIAIPKRIINKRGPLDESEWELIKTHTVEAQRMLERIGGLMSTVGGIVRSAHERYDGEGYPDGLAGEQIPLESRIIFCCDAFNAITTDRPYRRGRSAQVALAELEANAGSQFDPEVVAALEKVVRGTSSGLAPARDRDGGSPGSNGSAPSRPATAGPRGARRQALSSTRLIADPELIPQRLASWVLACGAAFATSFVLLMAVTLGLAQGALSGEPASSASASRPEAAGPHGHDFIQRQVTNTTRNAQRSNSWNE